MTIKRRRALRASAAVGATLAAPNDVRGQEPLDMLKIIVGK